LAETKSEAETKLADGLSALVPLKEFLAAEFVDPPTGEEKKSFSQQAGPSEQVVRVTNVSLALEEVGYEYTFSSEPSDESPETVTPIDFCADVKCPVRFARKPIGATVDAKKEERSGDVAKVGISGTITFPEEWPKSQNSSGGQ